MDSQHNLYSSTGFSITETIDGLKIVCDEKNNACYGTYFSAIGGVKLGSDWLFKKTHEVNSSIRQIIGFDIKDKYTLNQPVVQPIPALISPPIEIKTNNGDKTLIAERDGWSLYDYSEKSLAFFTNGGDYAKHKKFCDESGGKQSRLSPCGQPQLGWIFAKSNKKAVDGLSEFTGVDLRSQCGINPSKEYVKPNLVKGPLGFGLTLKDSLTKMVEDIIPLIGTVSSINSFESVTPDGKKCYYYAGPESDLGLVDSMVKNGNTIKMSITVGGKKIVYLTE